MATVAVFIALSGGAYAAGLIGSDDIRSDAVLSRHVARNALTREDVREETFRTVPNADRLDGVSAQRFLVAREVPHFMTPLSFQNGVSLGSTRSTLLQHHGFVVEGACVHDPPVAKVIIHRGPGDTWSYGDTDSGFSDLTFETIEVMHDETVGDGPAFESFQAMAFVNGGVMSGEVLGELLPPDGDTTRCQFSATGIGHRPG
jgi:hypothetical protein